VRLAAREAGDGAAAGRVIAGAATVFHDGTADTEYELWSGADERCVGRIVPGAFDGRRGSPPSIVSRCDQTTGPPDSWRPSGSGQTG
jgi:hypothetical protein